MKGSRIIAAGLVIGLFFTVSAFGQKTKYQSLFIYNFAKYIKWPGDFNNGKFVIGVLGSSEITEDLKNMVSIKKSIHGLQMEVTEIASLDEMVSCNLLFVTEDFCDNLEEVQNALNGTPTLIVTDKTGMAEQGAAINFVEQDGKIRFELNQSGTENLGLKISTSLTSLAIIV